MSPNDVGACTPAGGRSDGRSAHGSDEIVWTVVVAGGTGARFGRPKQYELVGGRRVLDWSVGVARLASDGVVVVVPEDDAPREHGVPGGRTRAESVRAGLRHVPDEATIICVHDAARPFASVHLFAAVVDAVRGGADGAVPGVPVTDTIKIVDDGTPPRVLSTPDRASLSAVQTPQAFRAAALRNAHAGDPEGTDDAAIVEARGGRVVVVPGEASNRKITVPADLDWARAHLESAAGASS